MPSTGFLRGSLGCHNSGGTRAPRGKVVRTSVAPAGSVQVVGLSGSAGSDHRGPWNEAPCAVSTLTAPEGQGAAAKVRSGPVIGFPGPRVF